MKPLPLILALAAITLAPYSGSYAAQPKAAAKGKPAKAAAAKVIASCDVPEIGTCLDFTDKAKEKSETLCDSLQKKPEPKACAGSFVGSCEYPDGYFRRFYKTGGAAWPVKDAQNECKEKGGAWR